MSPRSLVSTILIPIAVVFLVTGCATSPGTDEPRAPIPDGTTTTPDSLPFPAFTASGGSLSAPVICPVEGTVTSFELDPFGSTAAVIAQSRPYYIDGSRQTATFEVVIGGIGELTIDPGEVGPGTTLGSRSGTPVYFVARSETLDPWLVRNSSEPAFYDGYWWFAPEWDDSRYTDWLSFRQVDSLIGAATDFYDRWAAEMVEDTKDEPLSVTFHYYPDLDRIRVPFVLTEYPRPVDLTDAVTFTETVAYNTNGVIEAQSDAGFARSHRIVLYWQNGFTSYLHEEYTLGDPLWLYCSYYSIDHQNRILVVFVRDFATVPDETVIENRISSYEAVRTAQ